MSSIFSVLGADQPLPLQPVPETVGERVRGPSTLPKGPGGEEGLGSAAFGVRTLGFRVSSYQLEEKNTQKKSYKLKLWDL